MIKYNNLDQLDKIIINSVIKEKTNSEMSESTGFSPDYIKRRLTLLFKLYKVKSKVGLVREFLKERNHNWFDAV